MPLLVWLVWMEKFFSSKKSCVMESIEEEDDDTKEERKTLSLTSIKFSCFFIRTAAYIHIY